MRYLFLGLIVFCLLPGKPGYSQTTDTLRATTAWDAEWIGSPNPFDMGDEYGVYCYHKTVNLTSKPSTFYIHVSADNHYKLYINGTLVSVGPARGNQYNWFYETINIAKYLVAGNNSIAAQVWEEADYRPIWQNTIREGFIIQGNTSTEEVMNTNNTWKFYTDASIGVAWGYFLAVNGENVNMAKAPTAGWNAAGFDDSSWQNAGNLAPGQLKGSLQESNYMLVPSLIPQRELTYQPITVVRLVSGISVPSPLPKNILPLTVPANKKVIVLLDQGFETNAFPVIKFSGGAGGGIGMSFAETLFLPGSNYSQKPNRDTVNGMQFRGLTDSIISNGNAGQSFSPFNFRTYRYMQIVIQTGNAPMTIDSLYGIFTGYPFKQTAVLYTDDPDIAKIRAVGWRTARLCAYETFTDCPYYEQLQYIADTRVQAMVSYYESGDDLLGRHAITCIDEGHLPEGITLSVYPTKGNQIITPFSLLYIGMMYDYYMYRNDNAFIKSKLMGERAILNFMSQYQGSDGSVKNPPYWNYVDGPITSTNSGSWFDGIPPFGSDGCSAAIDLQLLMAYQQAAAMEGAIGSPESAALFTKNAAQLAQTIQSKYYNPAKMLYADTKDQNTYSQAVNALAILSNVVPDSNKMAVGQRILADSASLVQCNIYFRYYLHQALVKAGLGDGYLNWLSIWRNDIAYGLSTWAEISDVVNNRSDCHGWGASPNIEFFRTVLGIDSYAPGFAQIKIEPHLGILTNATGEIMHPNGKIAVGYVLKNNKWKIGIYLPPKTSGIFVWKGVTYPIKAGENIFVI
jgi:alpha-L-rhamnosidase